jgi:pimeloyl-ACP methyl ester carboxylesterase
VCDRVSAKLQVLLAPMIPSPGEAPGDWWANTGHEQEVRVPADEMEAYYHDVPPALAEEALRRVRDHPSATSMREPWPLSAWPDVPTRVLLCRDDRVFPAPFLRRVARERLGITPDEIDGGHCVGLSRPEERAERLESYLLPHAPP